MVKPERDTDAGRNGLRQSIVVRVRNDYRSNREAFDRSDVERMRLAGFTRDEVFDVARTVAGEGFARRVVEDLDSYGEWVND